jgi:adenine deaminase
MLTATLTIMARRHFITIGLLSAILAAPMLHAQSSAKSPVSGKRYQRLAIRNAIIVDGIGTPAAGSKDIVIEGNTIVDIVPLDPVALQRGGAKRPASEIEIDATGKYVLPGLINAHAHVQDRRGDLAQPLEYEFKLWLACGITAVRI